MRRALALWPMLWILSFGSALADARLSVLVDVLKLNEAAAILADEGIADARSLNDDMLDGQGGPGWAAQVDRIYAPALMVELIRAELGKALSGGPLEDVITFYASPLGTRIIDLENAARRAIQDPAVEGVAIARYEAMQENGDPQLSMVTKLITDGDMISRNVTSAMNSNFQFFRGLVEGKAIEMTEQEMLADVSKDIEENTEDTTQWLSSYMLMAYSPLSEDEMRTYVAFSNSDPGKALNNALFAGFGKAYEDISYALGRAVALNMTAEEL